MMDHQDASELLAAFALDAVSTEESQQIEEHLATCPRCRAELDGHREVAGAMGNSVEPLPEGLWSSIAGRLPERHDLEAPPMPRLLAGGMSDSMTIRQREDHRARPPRGRLALVASLAVAAAAAAAVLGINLARVDNQVSGLQRAIGSAEPTAVETALETPGHHVINMESTTDHQLAQFVLVPDGRGYLVSSRLGTLSSKDTYQLWGVIDGQPISLGLLGESPDMAMFTLAGSVTPSKLAITIEPASGSVVPTGTMVASGTV
jgi:anti-sigma-K factor RskA